MKKVIALLLAVALLGCLMAGCGETENDNTLRLVINEGDLPNWTQIVEKFGKAHPEIPVELVSFLDYTALNQNVMSAHQAGEDYDLITVNHTDTLSFIKGELLHPLSEEFAERKVDVEGIIMGNLEDAGKMGDTLYTFPVNTDTRVMCVNTDLLAKYNLEIPTTMDEMLAAAKVISEANQGDYIFTDEMCTNGDYFSTYEAGIFLQSCGGQLYTVDENGTATATVDTPEMRDFLTFITNLLPHMPADCTTNNEARAAFCEGNIAMYTFGPWEYNNMDFENLNFNTTLVKVPAGKAGSVSTSGGFQIGVGSGTKKLDESMTFLQFLLEDPECMTIVGHNGLPTVEAAYESGDFAGEKYQVFMEQLQSSNLPQVPVANLGKVVATFTGYWNDMCVGNLTVDEVIAAAQPAVQAVLDENK